MSPDQGIINVRRFEGAPMDKEPIPGEEESGVEEEDKYVLPDIYGARMRLLILSGC